MEFGEQPIEHSTGFVLRLNEYETLQAEADKYSAELAAIVPGLEEKITAEREAELSPAEKAALDTPDLEKTNEQYRLAADAMDMLEITPRQLAQRIASEKPDAAQEAMELALKIEQVGTKARYTRNYRQTANYDYWKTRSEFEQTQDALSARENLYQAKQAIDNGDLAGSLKLYESGFAHWRKVLDKYPSILESSVMGSELLDQIKEYRRALDLDRGQTLPDDFPLWDIIEKFDSGDFAQELAARRGRGVSTDAADEPAEDDQAPESGSEPAPVDLVPPDAAPDGISGQPPEPSE
jgi:hypothetical protein